MKVNTLCTFQHYWAHLEPVVEALRSYGVEVDQWTTRADVEWGARIHPAQLDRAPCDVWMVAGSVDYDHVPGRPIYLEHGAGQTYEGDERGVGHRSYSTGTLDRVSLFLCPNLYVMNRRRTRQPDVPAVLVGMPRMDALHRSGVGWHPDVQRDVVAFAWHWDCQVVDEARSAFDHYQPEFTHMAVTLRRRGLRPVMTAHPRIAARARAVAGRTGWEWWDTDDVLWHAAVLAADNTSLMYEFASLDRPVVALNAPWYRRDASHGLRFWEAIPGEQADDAEQALHAVHRALHDDAWAEDVRATVNAYVCPLRDGHAADRAALAILDLVR